jgi:AraC-like DNA-binding protein
MTPTAQILWPRPSLGGCLFAAIVRDTRGTALSDAERFNHFPAGPFCAVTIMIDGRGHLIEDRERVATPGSAPLMPTYAVSGPQRGPTVSWNPGAVYAVTIIFYPDAFVVLSGLDVSSLVGCFVDAEPLLPAALMDAFRAFHHSASADNIHRSFAILEDGLELVWDRARPKGHAVSAWLQDWGRSVAARAALSGAGRSARQIARRVKASTGLTDRDLDAFGRSKKLYARIRPEHQAGQLDWARLASDVGFSDQSHMVRRVRRETGLSPRQLLRAVEHDEAFWCYRLLGERY